MTKFIPAIMNNRISPAVNADTEISAIIVPSKFLLLFTGASVISIPVGASVEKKNNV